MDVILWRHAEAEDGGADLPDYDRKLTAKGANKRSKSRAGSSRACGSPRPSTRVRRAALRRLHVPWSKSLRRWTLSVPKQRPP